MDGQKHGRDGSYHSRFANKNRRLLGSKEVNKSKRLNCHRIGSSGPGGGGCENFGEHLDPSLIKGILNYMRNYQVFIHDNKSPT